MTSLKPYALVRSDVPIDFEVQNNGKVLLIKDALYNHVTGRYSDIKLTRSGWGVFGLEFWGGGKFSGITPEIAQQVKDTYGIVLKTLQAQPSEAAFWGNSKKTSYFTAPDAAYKLRTGQAEDVKKSYPYGQKKKDLLIAKEDASTFGAIWMTLHDAINAGIWHPVGWAKGPILTPANGDAKAAAAATAKEACEKAPSERKSKLAKVTAGDPSEPKNRDACSQFGKKKTAPVSESTLSKLMDQDLKAALGKMGIEEDQPSDPKATRMTKKDLEKEAQSSVEQPDDWRSRFLKKVQGDEVDVAPSKKPAKQAETQPIVETNDWRSRFIKKVQEEEARSKAESSEPAKQAPIAVKKTPKKVVGHIEGDLQAELAKRDEPQSAVRKSKAKADVETSAKSAKSGTEHAKRKRSKLAKWIDADREAERANTEIGRKEKLEPEIKRLKAKDWSSRFMLSRRGEERQDVEKTERARSKLAKIIEETGQSEFAPRGRRSRLAKLMTVDSDAEIKAVEREIEKEIVAKQEVDSTPTNQESIASFVSIPLYQAKTTPIVVAYDDASFEERRRRLVLHLDRSSPVPFSAFVDNNRNRQIDELLFRKMTDALRRLAVNPNAHDRDAAYMKKLFKNWFRAAYHYLDKNSKPGDGYPQILSEVLEKAKDPKKAETKAREIYWRRHATVFWMTLVDLFAQEKIGIDRFLKSLSTETSLHPWF